MGRPQLEYLSLARKPSNCVDDRFTVRKNIRNFRCDKLHCTNGGPDGDAEVGDWLFDENNLERFRPINLDRRAVHSGRHG